MVLPTTQDIQRAAQGDASGCQKRVIVIAHSQKRAAEVLTSHLPGYYTVSQFRDWWAESGNDHEVSLIRHGESVWTAPDKFISSPDEYVRAQPKPVGKTT